MTKRLAILTHEYYPVLSGGSVFSDKISHELSKLGWSVDILTARVGRDLPKVEHDADVDIYRLDTARSSVMDSTLLEHLSYFGLGLPQMFSLAKSKRYDLLFSVFAIPSGLMALGLSRALGMPNVVFVDASDTPGVESAMKTYVRYLGPLFRLVTHRAGGVVVLEGLEDLALPHVENDAVEIIPNGAVIPAETARPGENGPVLRLLSIGRLVLRKGFHSIIEVLGQLARDGVPVALTIVGYGRAEEEIRKTLDACGATDRVTFVGRVEHAFLRDYYLSSDAYLFYGDREGSSLAMIEAAAYGLPVIASDHPGNRTYVEHGKSGFLVPHPDPKALGSAIRHLVEHRSELAAMGRASRAVAERYSWAAIAARYDAFFQRVMTKSR
ncbi:MAG TPA: glycosyltransferase family 4 protein [Polyangiaceae bacterium]|jgi:glycosyltransferase involved in cell wall biosynthesis|nr:glycosyltransferase family 4 protein [Polyangiaceae bacterium]